MAKIKVVQTNNEKPVPVEVIAESIKAISSGVKRLKDGPLNEKALVLLIQHAAPSKGGPRGSSPISIREIKAVLEGMESLEKTYLKKKTKQ